MPKVPYPYEVNGKLVTGNGSLIPICSLSKQFLNAKFDCTIIGVMKMTKQAEVTIIIRKRLKFLSSICFLISSEPESEPRRESNSFGPFFTFK
jgi:hypothetical protein